MNNRHVTGDAFKFKIYTPFLICYIIYIVTFTFGVLSVRFNYTFVNQSVFSNLLSVTVNNAFIDNFLSFLAVNIIISSSIILSGYFVFGIAIDVIVFCFIGIGDGALFSLICKQCGAVGIAVNLMLFLIPTVLLFLLHTIIVTASAYFSNGMALAVFSNRSLIGIKNRMIDMLKVFALSIPCIAAISALRALFIMIFSGVFFA